MSKGPAFSLRLCTYLLQLAQTILQISPDTLIDSMRVAPQSEVARARTLISELATMQHGQPQFFQFQTLWQPHHWNPYSVYHSPIPHDRSRPVRFGMSWTNPLMAHNNPLDDSGK